MQNNLKDFYTILRNKSIRMTHQYQITFNITLDANLTPREIQFFSESLKDISIWADGVTLPGRIVNTADIKHSGYSIPLPNTSSMTQDLSLNLRLDNDMSVYNTLVYWIDTINTLNFNSNFYLPILNERIDVETTLNKGLTGGTKTPSRINARIDLFDESMKTIVLTYILTGIYPVNIGEIDMSHNTPEIATCKADFKYAYWVFEDYSDNDFRSSEEIIAEEEAEAERILNATRARIQAETASQISVADPNAGDEDVDFF